MTLGILWFCMLLAAILADILSGGSIVTGTAAAEGAARGAELALQIAGLICLWSGVSRVMERTGILQSLARRMRPLLGRMFPNSSRDETCFACLCGNLSADLLGLGNAATPLGIRTVRRMQALPGGAPIRELELFIVLNTASLQLIPTTAAAVRASLGAQRAFDILPAVWLSSGCSVLAGVLALRALQHAFRS